MEGDSKTIKKIKGWLFDVSHVLPTIWLRLPIQTDNGSKWVLLDSRRYLLFNFRVLLAIIYFAIQAFK